MLEFLLTWRIAVLYTEGRRLQVKGEHHSANNVTWSQSAPFGVCNLPLLDISSEVHLLLVVAAAAVHLLPVFRRLMASPRLTASPPPHGELGGGNSPDYKHTCPNGSAGCGEVVAVGGGGHRSEE